MSSMKHHFTINEKTNPATNEPFGDAYGGQFMVRRPSIADKKAIALKDAASLNLYGPVRANQVPEGLGLTSYIMTYVHHIAEEKLPEWFNMEKLYSEDDELAVLAVWEEVTAFLDSFRKPANTGTGGQAGGQPAGLVPPQV